MSSASISTSSTATVAASDARASAREGRLPVLDGVRGLAIVLVLVNNLFPETVKGAWYDTLTVRFTDFGWVGVDLFFVLSGFLITGILADTKDGPGYFRTFYARRVLRIFPLYYGTLFFLYVIVPWLGLATAVELHGLHTVRWYLWTYLGNWGTVRHRVHFKVDHFWSLAVEEQFYLAWPFFVWLLDRRRLVAFIITMMVASLVLRAAWLLHGLGGGYVYSLLPFRLDGLAVGSMVALMARDPVGRAWLSRHARRVLTACAPLALAMIAWYELPQSHVGQMVLQVFGYPLIALSFGALIVLALDAEPHAPLARWFGTPWLRWLGLYSYAVYVFHPIVYQLLMDRVSWVAQPPVVWGSRIPVGIVVMVLVSGIAIGLAWLSWHLYEKQWLKLKRYFRYAKPVETSRLAAE